ncbi:MAG: hypothetical protein GYB65_10050 [Chloroflexi bacterium]|nr:hypothetical protein [Chloroflexota bacterium]
MPRRQSGPSPVMVVLVGAFLVFGGYFVWSGLLDFLDDQGNITAQATREAFSTSTAQSSTSTPTLFAYVTHTPLPPCMEFTVSVNNAKLRECPQLDNIECPHREIVPYGTELCIYDFVPGSDEWYIVELNPGGAFRDIVYVNIEVVEAIDPTPTPSSTSTPLPTISPTPSATPGPTNIPSPSDTPDPASPPTPTPTPAPSSTAPFRTA